MARKRAGGAPKNERIGRKQWGSSPREGRRSWWARCAWRCCFCGRDWHDGCKGAQLACRRHRGHDHGAPVRHEREHHRRFVHHQRRLARVARTAALNRFAARPASQRRRRRKKGRWFGATRMQKAVEHNDARPPKKGVFQGARHSPSTFRPLIGRNQEERTSMRSTPASRNRHATRGRPISLRHAARIHRPSRRLPTKPSQPHERQHRRQQPHPFPHSRVSSP